MTSRCLPRWAAARRHGGFTLVEMLAVVAIVATILAIVIPSLRSLRHSSRVASDLANMRLLQAAQIAYATDFNGYLADARLPHGGLPQGENQSFVTTLAPYYDNSFALKSPLDASPHWPVSMGGEGVPVPGSGGRMRVTSYGINNFLARVYSPQAAIDPALVTDRLTKVRSPTSNVHLLHMAEHGDYAGSDHPHVESWGSLAQGPIVSATQVETAHAGGPVQTGDARTNWSFLDGHTATLRFNEVYLDLTINRFDPAVSATFDRRMSAAANPS